MSSNSQLLLQIEILQIESDAPKDCDANLWLHSGIRVLHENAYAFQTCENPRENRSYKVRLWHERNDEGCRTGN